MARKQLDSAAVAALLGVRISTVYRYTTDTTRYHFPPPDGRIGGSPWWWSSTIERWQRRRPGQGRNGGRPIGYKLVACAHSGEPSASIGDAGICPSCDKIVKLRNGRFRAHGRMMKS